MRRSVRTVLTGLVILGAAFLAVHAEVRFVFLNYRLHRDYNELERLNGEKHDLEYRRGRALEGFP